MSDNNNNDLFNNVNNVNNEIVDIDTYNQESQMLLNPTQQQLNNIIQAIARGERTVKFGDRYVEYRSIDELIKAKSLLETELARKTTPRRSKITRIYAKGKGWRKK